MRAGDVLLLMDGRWAPVEEVRTEVVEQLVYNFHVDGLENYAVGTQHVLVHNKNGDELGDVVETESLYKAPQPGKAQKQLREGFDPEDFKEPGGDDRAYFAKDKSIADEYNRHYREGVIEVEIPKDVYDARLRQYEQPYQGGPRIELAIPHEDFDVLNQAVRRLHE